jgi:hypothetical protein
MAQILDRFIGLQLFGDHARIAKGASNVFPYLVMGIHRLLLALNIQVS